MQGSAEALESDDRDVEYEGFDGWYNNKAHPDLGAIDGRLIRILTPHYSDGVYEPAGSDRPNPVTLSEAFFKGSIGEASLTGKNAFLVFFGQQVVEEILDAQRGSCPPEYMSIRFPSTVHAENGTQLPYRHSTRHSFMPLVRTRYDKSTGLSPNNPRQQLNEITPWIDGGLVYGISKGWSDNLRTLNEDGKLLNWKDTSGGEFPVYNDIGMPMANPPPPSGPEVLNGQSREHLKKPRLLNVRRFFS